jgi:hypothetical protein
MTMCFPFGNLQCSAVRDALGGGPSNGRLMFPNAGPQTNLSFVALYWVKLVVRVVLGGIYNSRVVGNRISYVYHMKLAILSVEMQTNANREPTSNWHLHSAPQLSLQLSVAQW